MGSVIPLQGPGNFCKSRRWCLLLLSRAAQRCWHSWGDIWHANGLARGRGVWGGYCRCHQRDGEGPRVSKERGSYKGTLGMSSLSSALASFPCGFLSLLFLFFVISQRCYLLPRWGGPLARTSSSVKVTNGSIASLNSWTHATSWHNLLAQGGWAFSAQNCRALGNARVFPWLPEPVVLAHKVTLSLGKEGIPFYAVRYRC